MKFLHKFDLTKLLGLNLLLASLYFSVGKLTFILSVEYEIVTSIIFIPEGIGLAFALLWGFAMAPGIFLGRFFLSIFSGGGLIVSFGIGFFNALGAVLGVYLFRKWKLSKSFDSLRDVLLFVFLVLAVVQPLSATAGMFFLFIGGLIPDLIVALTTWVNWWIGNSLAQLLVVPLILSWAVAKTSSYKKSKNFLLTMLFLVSVLALLAFNWEHSPILLVLSYPILMLVGIRCNLREITFVNLLVTFALIIIGIKGYGVMEQFSLQERTFYISLIIAAGIVSSLILYALLQERQKLIDKLHYLAHFDELTGIRNRRSFNEEAKNLLGKVKKDGSNISASLLDLDHFKSINDNYGHAIGDLVLRVFARNTSDFLSEGFLFARLGGEEFVILMPGLNAEDAEIFVDELRRFIKTQVVVALGNKEVFATFSAGIYQMKLDDNLKTLLSRADGALYEAKEEGRDRVKVA